MRITLVIGGLAGGGAERVCVNLANAWVERGHHVTILTVSQNSVRQAYATDPRVQRRDIGWPRPARHEELNTAAITAIVQGLQEARCVELLASQLTLLALLRKSILAQEPDVVVSHLDITNIRVLAAMYETKVPVIVCEHTDAMRVAIGAWGSVRAAMYRWAHAVVTPHAESAGWLSKYGTTVVNIPNPLVAPLSSAVERNGGRRRLLALTRLSWEKRPELVVRAFASIASEFPKWDFDIYGDGHLRAWITNISEKLAPGRIRLHGFTNEPYDVLRYADLFVSTSWVEGFGNSIWEAMACGVPVVATEAGSAVRALVRHHVDGFIVNGESVEALASALANVMRDEPKRQTMAMRAAEVVNRFPLEASLSAWDALLSELPTNRSEFSL